MERLRKLQQKFLTVMTGSYRCTNRIKMLKMINQIDIVEELKLMMDAKELPKDERKEYKKSNREEILNEIHEFDVKYDRD